MATVYTKSADGKELVATEQVERKYDIRDLQDQKNMLLGEIASAQKEITQAQAEVDRIDALLAECTKLGVVEKNG